MRLAGIAGAVAVVAFWVAMNRLLILRVIEYRGLDEYRRGVIDYLGTEVRRERHMAIYWKDRRVGHTMFAIERTAGPETSGYHIEFDTRVDVDLAALGGRIALKGEGDLDSRMVPLVLKSELRLGEARVSIDGRREGDRFSITLKQGQIVLVRHPFPLEGLLLGDGLAPTLPVGGLRVGETYRVPVFDPISKESAVAETAVLREGVQKVGGIDVPCLEVETRFGGAVFRSSVTREGEVLRQELPPPLDIVLVREPPEKKKR